MKRVIVIAGFILIGLTLVGLSFDFHSIEKQSNLPNLESSPLDKFSIETTQSDSKKEKIVNSLNEYSELAFLIECAEKNSCGFSSNPDDSKSEYYEISNQIKKIAQSILDRKKSFSEEQISVLAEQLIRYPNVEVQKLAISMYETLPKTGERLDVVLNVLLSHYSDDLTTHSLRYLKQYENAVELERIDNFLMYTIRSGAVAMSQAIAENLAPFINENNLNKFQDVSSQLPTKSLRAKKLKMALTEYQLQKHSSLRTKS